LTPASPAELVALREALGLSQPELGFLLTRDRRQIWRWEHGEVVVPTTVQPWIGLLQEYVKRPGRTDLGAVLRDLGWKAAWRVVLVAVSS
jgi:transcriptional regulator with XRE-family HTH domain